MCPACGRSPGQSGDLESSENPAASSVPHRRNALGCEGRDGCRAFKDWDTLENVKLLAAILAACGFGFCGCSTAFVQRAENSDGLLEFLFDAPRAELAIAIERVSAVGGTIETAHVRVYGRNAFVSGLVGRGLHRAALGAHIDIEVIAASGKIAQAQSVNFLPSPVPSGRRGLSYSRYATRLQSIPPLGSSVRVTFHNEAPCAFQAVAGTDQPPATR